MDFCSACAEKMEMLHMNKKRSQGDEGVSFCSGLYLWVDGLAFKF